MTKLVSAPPRGVSWLALLFCVTAAAVGLGFDFAINGSARWIGAQPGGAATIGIGAAAFVVLARHIAAVLRARPPAEREASRR